MNKQYQSKKKQKSNQAEETDDDEQIEKTLNFLDAIIDQYLNDENDHVTTSSSSSSSSQVRRFISENSLNQILASSSSSSSKPKISRSQPVRTTTTSTENLSTIPSQKSLSDFIKKTNELSANGGSASLIDLSSIDKPSSRPRFRFVPSSDSTHVLKEEPEIEHAFHLKTIPTNQKSLDSSSKPSHKIVKPIVIIPSVPKSAPINRLAETNIHHQNGNSAFKPHRSSKNGVSSKIQQIKRTESIQKPHVHVGLTNSDPLSRQKSTPQFHQSMLNLPSTEVAPTNRYAPRTSYESNKTNARYPTRPIIYDDPIARRIQQVNNTSSITGLVHPEHRSQLPYGSYISSNTGISSPMNNHRQQTYYNPQKHNSFQHPTPVQSVYLASPPVARNAISSSSPYNVYNFNHNHSPRNGQSKHHPNRQNLSMTTYL